MELWCALITDHVTSGLEKRSISLSRIGNDIGGGFSFKERWILFRHFVQFS
jgi:hypothetical protein